MRRMIGWIMAGLCLLLLVTKCNPLLDHTYTVVNDHAASSNDLEEDAVLEADTYEELVECILTFVYQGEETGRVRLPSYDGDTEEAIYTACQEVLQETAMGAYALYNIDYYCTHVVSYYECQFLYSYSHTPEQIWSVIPVSGQTEITEKIEDALSSFKEELVMEVNDASITELGMLAQVKDIYYHQPVYAVEYPRVSAYSYPEKGVHKIIELKFSWQESQETLANQVVEVQSTIANVAGRKVSGDLSGAWQLYSRLSSRVDCQEGSGSGVYDALVIGQADSQGLALAYQALCEHCGITCCSVCGTQDNAAHWWNIITVDGISWHVDLSSREQEENFLHTDNQMEPRYSWSGEEYPLCNGG